jgi:hypothetical protein
MFKNNQLFYLHFTVLAADAADWAARAVTSRHSTPDDLTAVVAL